MTEPETEIVPKARKRFWPHKRTVVVLVLLGLFWYLVCLPGTRIHIAFDSPNPTVSRYLHGWPLVHLESYRESTRGRSRYTDAVLRDAFQKEAQKRSAEPRVFNLRLSREKPLSKYLQDAFSSADSLAFYQIRWLGVVINLLVFVLIFGCTGYLVERRIRRDGKLLGFRFQLRTLLIMFTLFVVLFSWLLSSYRTERARYQSEKRLNDLSEPLNYAGVVQESQTILPLLISQLLNHGQPWIRLSEYYTGFFRIKEGFIDFSPYQPDELMRSDRLPQIIEDLQRLELPVQTTVAAYCDDLEALFLKLEQAGVKIKTLELDVLGVVEDGKQVRFFPNNKFPDLTEVTLLLSTSYDQRSQIERFLKLPKLEKLIIRQVNIDGAKFIDGHKDKFPRCSYFDFEPDVPKELIQSITPSFEWK